jgi:hypothetical protein
MKPEDEELTVAFAQALLRDIDRQRLPMFTIYDHPEDFEDTYMARLWYSLPQPTPTAVVIHAPTLKALRDFCAWTGARVMPRSPGDDAYIVESWLL